MDFNLDDVANTEFLLGQMAPLTWWHGEGSYGYNENPYANDSIELRREYAKIHEKMGIAESIEVNMKSEHLYLLTQEDAQKAFQAYAKAGEDYIRGASLTDIYPLVSFMDKYGVPCDLRLDELPARAFETIRGLSRDSVRAAFAFRLADLAVKKRWSQIRQMAQVPEDGLGLYFRIETPDWAYNSPPLEVPVPKENISSHQWVQLALEGAKSLASERTTLISVTLQITKHRSQIMLSSNGLLTSMWLSFLITLSNANGMPALTKTCLSHGKFTGCGRQFVPQSTRDRLCPECRAKAKAEAQARWRREKAKRDAQE